MFRRHGEVGVENEEQIAGGDGEGLAHGPALALAVLFERLDVPLREFRLHALNHFPGVVLRSPLDKNNFRARSHLRGALDGGLDVAGLVPGRDDDGTAVVPGGTRLGPRPRHQEYSEAKGPTERRKPAIKERADQRGAHRPEDARVHFDQFPACQVQQVLHIRRRKPVLLRGGCLGSDLFRKGQDGAPEVVKEIKHQTGVRFGKAMCPGEQLLNVRHIIHQVGNQDVVEGCLDGKGGDICHMEFELGMALSRLFDDGLAEIDPHSVRRFHCGEQFTGAAPQFQHPHSRWNQEPVKAMQQLMVMAGKLFMAQRGTRFVKGLMIGHRFKLLQ